MLPSLSQLQSQRQQAPQERAEVPPLRTRTPLDAQGAVASSADDAETHKRSRSPARPSGDAGVAKKSSYSVQREEREALADTVHALEAEIDAMRLRAGLPTREELDAVDDLRATNFNFEEMLHRNDLYLGRLHSLVTNELLMPTVNTLSTFIHLPQDMAQRRAILREMQELKLRRGLEFALASLAHVDHSVPYVSEETSTSATGEYQLRRFTIQPLPNFPTARQLYDVYVHFMYNLEVSITEETGQIALREELEEFDPTIWNQRILTLADDVGCTEEINIVSFSRFYERSEHTNLPMGVLVLDTVNVDDLYPYLPDERTCKDIQQVTLMYELPGTESGETIVVFKQFTLSVQLVPKIPIAESAIRQLQENTSRWPRAWLKFLREYEVPGTSSGARKDSRSDETSQVLTSTMGVVSTPSYASV